MNQKFKQDKGTAGLTILLSVIVMLFMIGLLVMIFTLMGVGIRDSDTVDASESATGVEQNSFDIVDGAGTSMTTCASANQGVLTAVVVINGSAGTVLDTGNYTYAVCVLTATATSEYNNTDVNVTYSYTWAGESWDVINETTGAIANVTDWFDIFIVITAMVVLILLTVIIITAIRSSGLIAGETSANSVGTA